MSSPGSVDRGSTERFTDREKDYHAARPAYASAALDFILSDQGLGSAPVIADVGSGTGILSAQLLERTSKSELEKLFAVEPNASMREAAENHLADDPRFYSIDGTGEETGLAENSVHGITVAQAFHWFDFAQAQAELRRIARSGARAAVLWNSRDEVRDELHRAYDGFLCEWGVGYEEVRASWAVSQRMGELFRKGYRLERFEYVQQLDLPGLRSRLLSSSYSPVSGTETYAPAMQGLDTLFERYASGVGGERHIEMVYACECHVGTV